MTFKRSTTRSLNAAVALALLSAAAGAAEPALEAVTISATRLRGVDGFDAPASVTRIGLDADSGRPDVNMTEVLAGVPGVAALAERPSNVRSVYLPVLRDHVDEMLDVFDFAEPAYVSGDRDETSVPTQALFMMNDERVMGASLAMARRVMKEGDTESERINRAFLLALGRKPAQSEVTAVRAFFKDFPKAQGGTAAPRRQRKDGGSPDEAMWAAFCQALFQSAEFRMVD